MEEFNLTTLGELQDHYVKKDVLLLCDVFEEFRNVCLANYGLDPTHYFTSPGLAHDASLKITKIELELLTDYDMFLMFESGIREGISIIPGRYSKASNRYGGSCPNFDPTKEQGEASFIQYLDANNLYGWAMSQPMPTGNFRWCTEEDKKNWDKLDGGEDSPTGALLEIDL